MKPRRRSEGGFTLVEVVVAFTLISVIMLGVAAYGLVATRSLVRSKKLSVATVVAHQTLDSLRQLPFNTLTLGTATKTIATGKFSFYVTTSVVASDSLALPRLKTVTVSIVDNAGHEVQRLRSALFTGPP